MAAVAHRQPHVTHRPHNVPVNPASVSEEHQKGRTARERLRHRPENKSNMMPGIIAGALGVALVIALIVWAFVH